MRGFVIFCIIGVALALPQGYNYAPANSNSQIVHTAPSSPIVGGYPGMSSFHGSSHNMMMMMMMRMRNHGSMTATAMAHYQHQHGNSPHYTNAHLPQPQAMVGGQIIKNFFIHSAPEETDDELLQDSENAGSVNKKYNIVFIKAPTESAKSAALALARVQSKEKTLIYVLNKKFDASELEAALNANPTEPTKPEVVFIKYKTSEEAALAQQQIQAQYDALGGGPTHVSDEGFAPVSSYIGSLGHSGGNLGASSSSIMQANSRYLPPSV